MNPWVAAWSTWLEHDKELAPSTCKLYRRYLQTLERDLAKLGPVEKLGASDLRSWLHSKAGSPSSYGNRVAALRSFYRYLVEQRGFLRDDPTSSLDVPKRALTGREPVRDLTAKLGVLDQQDEKLGRRVGESSDMAIFLAQTGMRVSDACALALKSPVPEIISIPRRRGHDKTIELTDEARHALDRLHGRFGIGTRALQRRFEKAGFHPDQLRHWHRINMADRALRDEEIETNLGGPAAFSGASPLPERSDVTPTAKPRPEISVVANDPLSAVGRFLRLTEDVAAVLVREARREGRSWEDIAHALSIPEAIAKERFAA